MTKENWHDGLVDLLGGLGEADARDACHATYIGNKIFGLLMPDDYEREGKAGVFSKNVIREQYLIDDIRKRAEFSKPDKDVNIKYYLIGKLLSELKGDPLKFCALYLAWRDENYPPWSSEPEYQYGGALADPLCKIAMGFSAFDDLKECKDRLLKKLQFKPQTLSL